MKSGSEGSVSEVCHDSHMGEACVPRRNEELADA